MSQPVWETAAGSLGTIPEGIFYSVPLVATADNTVYYRLIAGALPPGMQITETGVIAGVPTKVQGVPLPVTRDTTSKFAVRAYTLTGSAINRLADRTFTIQVADTTIPAFVTPPGEIAQLYDGSLITDLQIQYTGPESTVVRLASGSLPPGLTINSQGQISGLLGVAPASINYDFTLEVSDGTVGGIAVRAFSIYVWSRSTFTADTTLITADNIFLTADISPFIEPVLLNPQGSIGTVRNDDFFAYKFNGVDPEGGPIEYVLDASVPLPGLTLDPNSGWLYGYIPPLGITETTYDFVVRVRLKDDITVVSPAYVYNLTVIGPVNTDITWLTPSDLGSIDNGSTSIFYVAAVNVSGIPLQYRLLSGSDSSLPQGLELLPTGDIAGRVSFNTFALDSGTTTFDNNTTTFDLVYTFTVNAYSVNGLISVNKTFSITVVRRYDEPYENLYIQAMPPLDDRVIINGLLQNSDIFNQDLIYRPTDPYFGVATNVTYYHAYGLRAANLVDYVDSLDINHYWKNLTLGQIQVAQAKNSLGEVVYEVVYSKIIDDLVNAEGDSVSKEVTVPYPITLADSTEISTVYPNSLINMRDQVIDTVGQISTVLPLWMISPQENGQVLGFTPAWVIAYAKPGKGKQLAYFIGQDFTSRLNIIDYEVDRYELDRFLTKNWNTETDQWVPTPAETTFDYPGDPPLTPGFGTWGNYNLQYTVFTPVQWVNVSGNPVTWTNTYDGDQTVFDGNSLKFIAPVDMYVGTLSNAQVYDKYLVFPRRNILE
jgi:hypothetical protein